MEFCDKESLLLFSLSSSRCLWAIDLIVTTIICRQWFQLKWFLAMIWPWLLFDYYHPKSSKSRFAQCFQWFSRNSAKQDVFGKNRTTLENTAFYPLMPENSDRRHCSCQALSLCKKARRKLMHLSLRLAFARTDCTPPWHIVYLWGETVLPPGIFLLCGRQPSARAGQAAWPRRGCGV